MTRMSVTRKKRESPLYIEIAEELEQGIHSGEYRVGERLPTEQELAGRYGINRHTAAQALNFLQSKGLVVRVRGRGTFVRPGRLNLLIAEKASFSEFVSRLGLVPSHKVLNVRRIGAYGKLAEELRVPSGEPLVALERVGFAGEVPLVYNKKHFRDLEWFRRYWESRGRDEDEIAAALEEAEANGHGLAMDRVERVARIAAEHGAVLASHDDDTPERVELLARKGVRISEFPVNAESARRAGKLGLAVCMGAPNVVRGRSSGGNLSAAVAARLGLIDALCSDYHPPSMLQAAFKLARDGELALPAAVGLVTSGPARAAGLSGRGEIREGAVADLILVGERLGLPVVTHTIVGGAVASETAHERYGSSMPPKAEA